MSIEQWARRYIESVALADKLSPPPLPEHFAGDPPLRIAAPGRPPELRPGKGDRIPKGFTEPRLRAKAMHAFFMHELQAAELMCWAVLAFADAEEAFRRGLLRVCLDEIRHMNAYKQHIERLGGRIGEHGVRDWFWSRVPTCETKLAFVAVMGMGLEGANLEHAPAFADAFRAAGDEEGARVQEVIARDEMAHVKFATRWFKEWTGGCDFAVWLHALPRPWSPMVLRGEPLAQQARLDAGMSNEFLRELRDYVPEAKGRT